MELTFKKWMKKFIKDENAIGDLARDMYADKSFPKSNDLKVQRRYLKPKACEKAMETFEKAWALYEEAIF